MDLGLEAAGFETVVSVESDRTALETLSVNRPDWRPIGANIHEVSSERILSEGRLGVGDATLLVGGPPCQPFSKSAYWSTGDTRRLDDPRASTLEQFLRVLRDTQPMAFVMENVPGLRYKSKDEGLGLLYQTLEDINAQVGTSYDPTVDVLNAADFGVPQDRKRLFVMGHREGKPFDFPPPTHGVAADDQMSLDPTVTAWDAIGDLEDDDDPSLGMTGKWADLLPSIPEGQNYLYHTDRGEGVPLFGWRRRYWSFLLKLSKRLPSWTVTAQPGSAIGPFHWKNRRLSTAELMRLQTFSEPYRIMGGRTAAQKQLGNAVPSALAEHLGLEIRKQFLGDTVSEQGLTLIPDYRRPVPDAEFTQVVPEKYLHLEGEHEAHPGTGLGYAASERPASSG